jgi:hypothetical protein
MPGSESKKKNEIFDCCENSDLLKAYATIKQQLEGNDYKGMRQTQALVSPSKKKLGFF